MRALIDRWSANDRAAIEAITPDLAITRPARIDPALANRGSREPRSCGSLSSVSIEIIRKPERHSGPEIHDNHARNDDQHVGHHARENLIDCYMRWRDP